MTFRVYGLYQIDSEVNIRIQRNTTNALSDGGLAFSATGAKRFVGMMNQLSCFNLRDSISNAVLPVGEQSCCTLVHLYTLNLAYKNFL